MDRSTPGNVIEASTQPTVASILGVAGALHFHPHGSTQKAHVVLRRVDAPEDSEEGSDSSTLYFSLFAQKRIEVKPGKEILLAVAAPDGRIIDTPVILAAKVSNNDSPERHELSPEERTNVVAHTRDLPVPPKMRKSWSKRFEIVRPIESKSRSYTSASVQTQHETSPQLLERETVPSTLASAPEEVVGNDAMESTETVSPKQVAQSNAPPRRDRSLSPMELDSPGSSAPSSPHIPTPPLREIQESKSASFSPPGLWISTSPPKELGLDQDARITPLHLSPDSGDPPGLSSFHSPSQMQNPPQRDSASTAEGAQPSETGTSTTVVDNKESEADIPTATTSPVLSPGSKASPPAPETPTAIPYVPKRKVVPNPFVSGGLLTDFVGATSSQKSPVNEGQGNTSDATNPRTVLSAPAKSLSPPPGLSSVTTTRGVEEVKTTAAPVFVPSTAASNAPNTPVRTASPVASPPSSASSSKVKIEDVPLPTSDTPLPPPARPVSIPPQIPIPGGLFPSPADNRPPADTRRRWSGTYTQDTSPPPDPKSLAYIPTGSYSNPLNIRPSAGFGWRGDRGRPLFPPPGPPNPPRKPIAIGSGWPHNRQTNGHGRRQQFRRASNASEGGGQLPSQADAFRRSRAGLNPNGLAPGGAEENTHDNFSDPGRSAVEQGSRSRSSSGTWGAPGDGPHPPYPLDMIQSADEARSPPASNTPISPLTQTRGRSMSGSLGGDPASSNHPLPPKPPASAGPVPDAAYSPRLGVKRMGSPLPKSQTPEPRRARTFKWPVSEATHSVRIKGDGDVGVRTIAHSSDGTMLAITCFDKSVRIWNNKIHSETAKLAHNMQVIAVAWMDRDAGVITLGDNGIVSTWTRSAGNKWQWAKILDASDRKADAESPSCLAFWRDRIAIGYPRSGVKVWLFIQGTWLPQRSIIRQNVTVIKFVEDGDALVGGTTDGVLWYCQVPNGTLRAYAFLKSKIYSLDVDPKGSHALAAQVGGRAHLVNIGQEDHKGNVEQVYALNDADLQNSTAYDFGALFASGGSSLLFGCARGCVLVWDRGNGEIVHGLQHDEDVSIQAISCFDRGHVTEGHTLTGTRQGLLTWFSHPPSEVNGRSSR